MLLCWCHSSACMQPACVCAGRGARCDFAFYSWPSVVIRNAATAAPPNGSANYLMLNCIHTNFTHNSPADDFDAYSSVALALPLSKIILQKIINYTQIFTWDFGFCQFGLSHPSTKWSSLCYPNQILSFEWNQARLSELHKYCAKDLRSTVVKIVKLCL
jgi:hypothetical protein